MPNGNLPAITPAAFQVLLALARGRSHGYAIMGYVDELTAGSAKLGPGTLYRTLSRLSADGLVEEVTGRTGNGPHDARRRYYRLTELGRTVAVREARLLDRLTAAAAEAGLLDRQARSA
ncbi:PadR family transcriptional regulator [Prauserella oleivorans]|uniref:PadR family transcriptional regulator n=1 Tax=Prauserella oleivorans TaxID=1478153 RepID=A0ABW5WFM1_9PSEU